MDSFIHYTLLSMMFSSTLYYFLYERGTLVEIGLFANKGAKNRAWSASAPKRSFLDKKTVSARFAWVTQEAPALLISLAYLVYNWTQMPWNCRLALSLYVIHYANRTLIYSTRIAKGSPITLKYWLMAVLFCICNGTLQGNALSRVLIDEAAPSWIAITLGLLLYVAGMAGNIHSDAVMNRMNQKRVSNGSAKTYICPQQGLYKYSVAANYFCETMEWYGYWIVSGFSMNAFAFCLFCTVTLWTRAVHKYRHYKSINPKSMISADGWHKRPFVFFVDFKMLLGYDI